MQLTRRLSTVLGLWLCATTTLAVDVTIKGNAYTLAAHPRVFLDGASGTITTRVKDPDGAGASVAPQATDANPAFVALKNQVRSCRAAPDYCASANERSTTVLLLALDWYMDNSQTDSKTAAIWNLNNTETWISNGFGFGCDILDQYCGLSSWADWPSWDQAIVAQAYSLVRSEMSAGERTAFAQKMFNDDTAGYEDGCTNQLQVESGAVATFSTGGTAVTGSGFTGLTAGRQVYIRGSATGGWATISTVNSDASITLTGAPQYALGGNATGVTSGTISELKPWSATTCGLSWMLQHHAYSPRGELNDYLSMTTSAGYSSGDTTISVVSTTGLPTAPFYVKSGAGTGEIMLVNSFTSNSLSVTRAQMGTTADTQSFSGKPVNYSRYVPSVGTTDYAHNLAVQKAIGFIAAGLALADDSATARAYVTDASDTWLDYIYPRNVDMWTGFQQSGSSNYGPGRQLTENLGIVQMLKALGGSPSLDKSGGNWLAGLTDAWIYTALPPDPTRFAPWGQADIATETPDYHAFLWAPLLSCVVGESDTRAAYWNYYQRTVAGWYTSGNLTAGANERLIAFALPCWQESDTSTNYRAVLGTQRAFNVSDGTATKALGAFVSRTGWATSTDTLLFQQAFALWYGSDHVGTGAPGAYKVYKGGWTLGENGSKDTGVGVDTNMILFGGAANLISPVVGLSARIDRSKSGTGWAYARTNAQPAYTTATAVTRAERNLVHFKASGQPDYLVVYDSAATSSAKTIGQNLHYDKTAGQASSITDTLPNIVWTGPDRRVSTKVVLPSGTGAARTASSLTNSFREYLCASSDGTTCASVTSAAFLLVHKPSTSTSDTMPTVNAIATIDADFDGVEIADASAPSVAVFAKAGTDQNTGSFTTTLAGTAQIIVSGLVAGTYDITKDAGAYLADQSVDANGVLAFTGTAAAYAITQTGTATAPTITTTTLSNGVLGQSYSATLQASDGALPLAWDVSAGSLCTGLSLSAGGVLSGTPTTAQTCNFTARVTDDLAQTDTQALSLTIQTPPPTLTVRAQPGSDSVVLTFGTPGLSSSQSCDVALSAVSNVCVPAESAPCSVGAGSATSPSGAATRVLSMGSLSASTSHTATITCGTVAAGSVSFTTRAASGSGTYALRLKPTATTLARMTALDATLASARAAVYWKAPGEGSYTSTATACSSGCTVSKTSLASGVHSYYHEWIAGTAYATGAINWTNASYPSDGETVTVGSITYTFRTTVAQPFDVKIVPDSTEASYSNLWEAIDYGNWTPGVSPNAPGANYYATAKNPDVVRLTWSAPGNTATLRATVLGSGGNSIPLSETSASMTVTPLSGGTDATIATSAARPAYVPIP